MTKDASGDIHHDINRKNHGRKETPQFQIRTRTEADYVLQLRDRITRTYQEALGPDALLHITGGAALHAAVADQEAWSFEDLDGRISDIRDRVHLKRLMDNTRVACANLGGCYSSIIYAAQKEGGTNEMRDVLAKTTCILPQPLTAVFPKVNIIFTDTPLAEHFRGAKPPAGIVYAASDPTTFIVNDNHWLRSLRNRRLPPTAKRLSLADRAAMQIKYGPRGWLLDPLLASPCPPSSSSLSSSPPSSCTFHTVVPSPPSSCTFHTVVPSPSSSSSSRDQEDRLLKHIAKQQWRAAVTAKIHWRTSAAYRNLRFAEGMAIAGSLGASSLFSAPKLSLRVKAPFVGLSLVAGSAFVEFFPNRNAVAHQRAGARYGGLESEWALLHTQLCEARIRFDTADAHAANLHRRKTIVDRLSPNAPDFFKPGVVADLEHRRSAISSSQ